MPYGLPALIVQVDEAVEDGRGAEGEGGVVVVDGLRAVVPVFHHLVEVLDLVFAQGGVALDGEPGGRVDGGLQLDTKTIGVLDVRGQVLADVTHGTRLHKLVLVVHIIEVRAESGDVAVEGVTQLVVHQLFGLGGRVGTVISEVVALWLTVAHRQRTVDTMAVEVPGEACLGIEEVVVLVDVEALVVVAALVVVEFVVDAVGLVVHVTILDVGKHIP